MRLSYLLLLSIVFLLLGCEQKESKPKTKQVVIREPDPSEFEYADTPPDPEIVALRKRYTKMDERLKAYKDAKYWFRDAYEDYGSSYNLGLVYLEYIKDYKEAIYWYRISWNLQEYYKTSQNLGFAYAELNEKEKALDWYLKSWKQQKVGFLANNIGLLYMEQFKDDKKALYWYKKALELEDKGVLSNLGTFYHERGETIKGAAYIISRLGHIYDKEKKEFEKGVVLKYLREEFKLNDNQIKEAHSLQKRMPELKTFFYGELFEKK